MAGYTITQYRASLKDQVAALHSSVFGIGIGESRSYLEWKYERNPYMEEPTVFLAQDSAGAVVGMRGFYGSSWEIGGRRTVIPCADDFAIAAEHRNSGMATDIMRTAQEHLALRGYSHVLNASGGTVTVLQSLAMGWRSLGGFEPVARISRRARFAGKTLALIRRSPLIWRLAGDKPVTSQRFGRGLLRAAWPSHAGDARVTVHAQARPVEMAACARRPIVEQHMNHVHDEVFYRWRFANPSREYVFAYLERGDALVAFLVIARYRTLPGANVPFMIVDWAAADDSTLSSLLGVVLEQGRFSAIGTWARSWSAGGQAILASHRFEPSEMPMRARGLPCLLIKHLHSSKAAGPTLQDAIWNIRPIDSMRS